jgi:multicomponent Na+:H+ antiporter subunit E
MNLSQQGTDRVESVGYFRALLTAILLTGLWWMLTEGDRGSWVVGVPAILAALAVRHTLPSPPPWRLSLPGLVGFAVFFVRESLRGGIDVALRVFRRELPIRPGFVRYRLSLPEGSARVLMVNVVSLLPGTLAVDLSGDDLTVQALDDTAAVAKELTELESRIGRLLALELPRTGRE